MESWRSNKVLCEMLKCSGSDDYDFDFGFLKSEYFESRKEFDQLYSDLWVSCEEESNELVPLKCLQYNSY